MIKMSIIDTVIIHQINLPDLSATLYRTIWPMQRFNPKLLLTALSYRCPSIACHVTTQSNPIDQRESRVQEQTKYVHTHDELTFIPWRGPLNCKNHDQYSATQATRLVVYQIQALHCYYPDFCNYMKQWVRACPPAKAHTDSHANLASYSTVQSVNLGNKGHCVPPSVHGGLPPSNVASKNELHAAKVACRSS
jgi:hypothetical protein